jgi:hypothetical protein
VGLAWIFKLECFRYLVTTARGLFAIKKTTGE